MNFITKCQCAKYFAGIEKFLGEKCMGERKKPLIFYLISGKLKYYAYKVLENTVCKVVGHNWKIYEHSRMCKLCKKIEIDGRL